MTGKKRHVILSSKAVHLLVLEQLPLPKHFKVIGSRVSRVYVGSCYKMAITWNIRQQLQLHIVCFSYYSQFRVVFNDSTRKGIVRFALLRLLI